MGLKHKDVTIPFVLRILGHQEGFSVPTPKAHLLVIVATVVVVVTAVVTGVVSSVVTGVVTTVVVIVAAGRYGTCSATVVLAIVLIVLT